MNVLFAFHVQISYLILLVIYSYFMMVELSPRQPTICEYIVWIWAATLWFEELRQVNCNVKDFTCVHMLKAVSRTLQCNCIAKFGYSNDVLSSVYRISRCDASEL